MQLQATYISSTLTILFNAKKNRIRNTKAFNRKLFQTKFATRNRSIIRKQYSMPNLLIFKELNYTPFPSDKAHISIIDWDSDSTDLCRKGASSAERSIDPKLETDCRKKAILLGFSSSSLSQNAAFCLQEVPF